MEKKKRTQRIGRRGKVWLYLLATLGTIGTLLWFEQVAVIYVLTSIGLIVLLLLVAFSDLEKIGKQAQIEAHLVRDPADQDPTRAEPDLARNNEGSGLISEQHNKVRRKLPSSRKH